MCGNKDVLLTQWLFTVEPTKEKLCLRDVVRFTLFPFKSSSPSPIICLLLLESPSSLQNPLLPLTPPSYLPSLPFPAVTHSFAE